MFKNILNLAGFQITQLVQMLEDSLVNTQFLWTWNKTESIVCEHKKNSEFQIKTKTFSCEHKISLLALPDFLFSPSPDFVYTRDTSTAIWPDWADLVRIQRKLITYCAIKK